MEIMYTGVSFHKNILCQKQKCINSSCSLWGVQTFALSYRTLYLAQRLSANQKHAFVIFLTGTAVKTTCVHVLHILTAHWESIGVCKLLHSPVERSMNQCKSLRTPVDVEWVKMYLCSQEYFMLQTNCTISVLSFTIRWGVQTFALILREYYRLLLGCNALSPVVKFYTV